MRSRPEPRENFIGLEPTTRTALLHRIIPTLFFFFISLLGWTDETVPLEKTPYIQLTPESLRKRVISERDKVPMGSSCPTDSFSTPSIRTKNCQLL